MPIPKGYKHSEATRIKMRKPKLSKINYISWNKGKHLSEKIKENIRKTKIGLVHSETTKKLMSKVKMGDKNPFYGKHHSEETKRKIREARLKQKPFMKDTSIEIAIENELKLKSIYYEKQVPLCKICVADFYLPQYRAVIFCDGTYWHSREKNKGKDISQDMVLTFNGFNVFRFKEGEIKKSPKRCINKILRFIGG